MVSTTHKEDTIKLKSFVFLYALVCLLIATTVAEANSLAWQAKTPTFTFTPSPTNTPAQTPTKTPTRTPTNTPSPTNTFTPTPTPTPTPICNDNAEIPIKECEALQTLYENTGGNNWQNKDQWLKSNHICNWHSLVGWGWYGVTCTPQEDAQTDPDGKRHITILTLPNNHLQDNLPPQLSNLSKLEILDLHNNQLNGSIPPKLGDLPQLQTLNLFSNTLSGSIPPALGQLLNLQTLNLSYNQLSGFIPPELGNLTNLTTLNLSHNQLNGSIPAELYATPRLTLTTLALNHNLELTGTLALSISNLMGLQHLGVQSTSLQGRLPVESLRNLPLETMSYTQTQLCEPSGTITFTEWLSHFRTNDLERNFEPCIYSISGRLTDEEGQPVRGGVTFQVTDTMVLLALRNTRAKSSAPQHTLTIDENGYYVLDNFANGTYIIKPVANDAVFVPIQQMVTVLDSDVADVNFVRWTNYTITGQVIEATTKQPLARVTIMADTDAPCYYPSASCYYYDRHGTTDAHGSYTITYVFREKSAYTLTPEHPDYTFSPLTRSVTVNSNVIGQDFTGYTRTYTVTGQVTDTVYSENLEEVKVLATREKQEYTATIDAGGLYTVANLLKNTYVFTARQPEYEFNVKKGTAEVLVTQDTVGPTFERVSPLRVFTVSGQVVYKGGEPISQVVVSAVGSNYQSTTDDTGNYTITTVEKGQYTLMPKKEPLTFSPTERLVIVTHLTQR